MNRKKFLVILLVIFLVIYGGIVFYTNGLYGHSFSFLVKNYDLLPASIIATVKSPFLYTFAVDGILKEVGGMNETTSPYWWLNSGGKLILAEGLGKTVQGELPVTDKWRLAYLKANPLDTDNGYHPQNIFRLVTRSKWQNFTQEGYFLITKDNLSDSPNRNASNGLLFFNRYQDGQNLYYTGIRVDGYAVIKKKIRGVYYTMDYKPFISVGSYYNRETNPSFLPKNTWIGLKSEIKTNPDGTVAIKLYVDLNKTGKWVLAAGAVDNGKSFGGAVINSEGYAGIRTDFMDVWFDDYRLTTIK